MQGDFLMLKFSILSTEEGSVYIQVTKKFSYKSLEFQLHTWQLRFHFNSVLMLTTGS